MLIALFALCGMLFQQLAVAAYVCDLEFASARSAIHDEDPLPPCHEGAKDKARCHAHCHPTASTPMQVRR